MTGRSNYDMEAGTKSETGSDMVPKQTIETADKLCPDVVQKIRLMQNSARDAKKSLNRNKCK